MMHAAFDEIRRMAFKALDGGGAAAGIDEDSAFAVAWLEAVGLPGLTVLADAMDDSARETRAEGLATVASTPSDAKLDAAGRSSVFFAPSVIDLLIALAQTSPDGEFFVELNDARHPAILLASAARYCPRGGRIAVNWQDVACTVAPPETFIVGTEPAQINWLDQSAVKVALSCDVTGEGQPAPCGFNVSERLVHSLRNGLSVDDAAHKRVSAYADKILVPESELSRQTGAGAGLTDND